MIAAEHEQHESSEDIEWSMHDCASRLNASFWGRNGFGDLTEERAAARAIIRQELAYMRRLKARHTAAKRRDAGELKQPTS